MLTQSLKRRAAERSFGMRQLAAAFFLFAGHEVSAILRLGPGKAEGQADE